ncbi:carboxylesterase/lipase family protein [Acinetobacter sp. MD2(2019)]|uniref:carboxylesterase/lipase family protein n=1 Tax=Acinetobacter sp. MD2(2019) TaxID=2605273 RepID=UPI002D1E78D4|nr:carboxylesterase/lipase family protein [Acinetobacter sp. MD2(2019)]MEB3754081.1 carboxylesterase family protein [Acinetobacter sp. MD2(2019)]
MALKTQLKWLGLLGMVAPILMACQTHPLHLQQNLHRTQIIQTERGEIQGTVKDQTDQYLGIPYAQAPVGENRFRSPQVPSAWQGIKQTIQQGHTCVASVSVNPDASEDCLYLNVYVPKNSNVDAKPKAVIFWIHGGAYVLGSTRDNDPAQLAEKQNVIVVSINYRLGALGFFAHPELKGTSGEGNFAIQDQQAALKWVNRNIAQFGGDPNNITLMGESAGSGSVCTHLVAPSSKGLFKRVIMESGSCVGIGWSTPQQTAEQGGLSFAKNLGCTGNNDLSCLRKKSAKQIMQAKASRSGITGKNGWSPMIGGDVLPISPLQALKNAQTAKVPMLVGTNANEGDLFAILFSAKTKGVTTRKNLQDGVAEMLNSPELAEKAMTIYQPRIDKDGTKRAFSQIFTDSVFVCPTTAMLDLYQTQAPIYQYQFEDPNAPFRFKLLKKIYGLRSYHASELHYVFASPNALTRGQHLNAQQQTLSDQIQRYWGNFAKTGNPNGEGLPTWQPYPNHQPFNLSIAGLAPVTGFKEKHHCDFWNNALI